MEPLPSEYDGFNLHYLAYDEPWNIILGETLRYDKIFPNEAWIGEYDLKNRSDIMLNRASNGDKVKFGGSYQPYMKRFSTKNPKNEKYYTFHIKGGKRGYSYKIDLIEQRFKAEKLFNIENRTAILRKHGIFGPPDNQVKKYSITEVKITESVKVSDQVYRTKHKIGKLYNSVKVSDHVGIEVRDAKGKIKKIG